MGEIFLESSAAESHDWPKGNFSQGSIFLINTKLCSIRLTILV